MTDLQAQATAFAAMMMKDDSRETFNREDMYHAYRDAYEQGWVDCDTEGETPETQDGFFNEASDCRYFSKGDCAKGLPGTLCERKGCVAYYPKEKLSFRFPIVGETEPYVYDPNNRVFDWSVHIDLARCTPTQLRYLSELGYGVGEVISNKCKAKEDENEAE